ncbi:RNA-binding protein 7-like isoform X2 [Rhopalosiphum maidis]|uniref:RNA-binding protein 7-like isoform X2 n=1 Tax=Rhopalosiphum maidis TaxID=43146 RepID=UPI000EFFCD3A|nr:RNA-binding protein 7-like isoform X2 [Rhopalosiphum maidis]
MDSADDVTNNDEIEKRVRTLWVGNLHPKVSSRDIAELFYQVGPVEYVEFAYDENEICENFALVVFKYSSSVEDSLKFFKGTKLYGLPIITKNYSNHFEDPVFNEQLNYFKQLIKVEQNCQPNSPTECKWIDQSLDEKNIPESLPQPPMHEDHSHNKNHDNYDRRCSSKVNSSKYRHHARNSKRRNSVNSGEYYPIDKSHHSQKNYKNSEHNSSSGSMEMFNYERDSYYNNPNNDRKHHDHTSFNRKESAYHNQEPMSTHEKHSGKNNNMLVRDLRDTMFRKRNRLDSNFHIDMNTNAGCTSLLDLRDTMYQKKNSKYEDLGQQNYELDSNNRWSERNQNIHVNQVQNIKIIMLIEVITKINQTMVFKNMAVNFLIIIMMVIDATKTGVTIISITILRTWNLAIVSTILTILTNEAMNTVVITAIKVTTEGVLIDQDIIIIHKINKLLIKF